MSKNPKPAPEELRFVYDLILKGYSDTDILNEYTHLYEQSQLQFPLRGDKRFIKDRRKELEAASEVLQEHVKKRVDPIISQQSKEHFQHLADVAQSFLAGDLDKVEPDLSSREGSKTYTLCTDAWEKISHKQLILKLEDNIEKTCSRYSAWDFWHCFIPHLQAEYPELESKDLLDVIRDSPLELIDKVRLLARRKTFKGTCPVCKDW